MENFLSIANSLRYFTMYFLHRILYILIVSRYHYRDVVLHQSLARPRHHGLFVRSANACANTCASAVRLSRYNVHRVACARRGSRVPDVYLWLKKYFIIIIRRYGMAADLFSFIREAIGENECARAMYLHKEGFVPSFSLPF